MRAFVVLLIGLALLVPSIVLLQQPHGAWSLVWDTIGVTLGILGIIVVLVGFAMAVWRLVRGR